MCLPYPRCQSPACTSPVGAQCVSWPCGTREQAQPRPKRVTPYCRGSKACKTTVYDRCVKKNPRRHCKARLDAERVAKGCEKASCHNITLLDQSVANPTPIQQATVTPNPTPVHWLACCVVPQPQYNRQQYSQRNPCSLASVLRGTPDAHAPVDWQGPEPLQSCVPTCRLRDAR